MSDPELHIAAWWLCDCGHENNERVMVLSSGALVLPSKAVCRGCSELMTLDVNTLVDEVEQVGG